MKRLSLTKAVEFYLQQRRQLGFPLKEDGQMLHQLVGYASERNHRGALTSELALAWAQAPVGASRLWWARRLWMPPGALLASGESSTRERNCPRLASWVLLTVGGPFTFTRHSKSRP